MGLTLFIARSSLKIFVRLKGDNPIIIVLFIIAGLILVPPPIWIILCSTRTVFTTVVYKFVLKRNVTMLQFFGSGLIVASIIIAKIGKTRLCV